MTTANARKILDAFDRQTMLDLALDLVRIPSFKTEETPVARFLEQYLG